MTEPVKHEWVLQSYGMIDVSGLDPLQFFLCKHCGEGKCGERVPNPRSVGGCYKVWNRRDTCYSPAELEEKKLAFREDFSRIAKTINAEHELLRSRETYRQARAALELVKLHLRLGDHSPEDSQAFDLAQGDVGLWVNEDPYG